METRLCTVFVLLFMLSILNCRSKPTSFTDVKSDTVSLIDDMKSYHSIDNIKSSIASRSLSWEVMEDSSLSSKDKRPPFNIYTTSIMNYEHIGHSGELRLYFFNNRLAKVTFYPKDIDKYLKSLAEKRGIELRGKKHDKVKGHLRIWIYTDYRKQRYIGWEDIRLADEMKIWIRTYS